MASRQTQITTLAPLARQQQEQWAQAQLRSNAGACLAGWSWIRTEDSGGLSGYRCRGRGHFVTDELLARGEATCYMRDVPLYEACRETRWEGPFTLVQVAAKQGMGVGEYRAHMADMKARIEWEQSVGRCPFEAEEMEEAIFLARLLVRRRWEEVGRYRRSGR